MGIPTGGPSQGRNPAEGGLPSGRRPAGQQPAQPPRERSAGLPPQQTPPRREAPQQPPRGNGQGSGAAPQRPRGGLPAQSDTTPRRTPPLPRREAPSAQLPELPEESFNDPFSFVDSADDPFSDVPKSAYADGYADEDLADDDAFTYVPEAEDEDRYEPTPPPAAPVAPPRSAPAAQPKRLQGASRAPDPALSADDEYSEDFIDRKDLRLKPFGKSKKKAKVGDFDPRKNLEGQRKIYRGVFLTAIVVIVGFGAYQTFWPQENLSVAEVESIAALTVGETGFPTTRGEGFALSFTESLLNVEPGPEALAQRTAALSYFYGANGDSESFDSALTTVGSISQQVVYGPVALDSTPITANAASYEVAVLLNTRDTEVVPADDLAGEERIADSLRWVAFNVNVYYDESKNSFAIAPNSPTLLPAPAVEPQSVVPSGEPLGTAVDEYPESVNATVVGFLSGYRESTKTNFDKILQYIGTDADETLRDGLGSRYQFATPSDPASSIDIEVFQPGENLDELKVGLTVDWQIATGEESSVTFPSHYVLTLESSGGSDYTVTKFAPYYWTEALEPTE